MADSELERFRATRDTANNRLDLISKGAQITYEDGTPIDMTSEKIRLEQVVIDMDRRIAQAELMAATPTGLPN